MKKFQDWLKKVRKMFVDIAMTPIVRNFNIIVYALKTA